MIIQSLLNTDLYKLTQMQAVFHQFPKVEVKYKFICRNNPETLNSFPINRIKKEIKKLTKLRFTDEEINYLKSLDLFKDDFLNYLKTFKLSFSNIKIHKRYFFHDNRINIIPDITISGLWLETILFEVPLLAIINELYFENYDQLILNFKIGFEKLYEDIKLIQRNNRKNIQIKFIEFGTRRRFSSLWQEKVIERLKDIVPENLIGTSNVYFAKKFGLKPMGTMAHEWIQAGLVLAPSTREAQSYMLNKWLEEYQDKLSFIALTDTFGVDAFLKDFSDKKLNETYTGLRQDSGDPKDWLQKICLFHNHNKTFLESQKRTLIFSDNLDFEKCYDILKNCKKNLLKYFNIIFGIGTHLTNNLLRKPLNIVIKLVECNNNPVCKLSDDTGKETYEDIDYLNYVKEVFK